MSTSPENGTAVIEELLEAPATPETEQASGDGGATPPVPTDDDGRRKRRRIIALLLVAALLLVGGLFAWYLLNRKPLTALPGVTDTRPPSYQFSVYDLVQPLGVAVSPTGDRIYVTEGGGARDVKVLDHDGTVLRTVALPTTELAHMPVYLAVDPDNGTVYVTDRLTKSIYAFDRDGRNVRTVTPVGDLGEPMYTPLGIAVGPDHRIYTTDVRGDDASQHRVVVLEPDGKLVTTMGAPGELNYPSCIVVDDQGVIRVTDSNNGRLVTFGADGRMLVSLARGLGEGDLGLPRGLGTDDSGRLFVVDTTDHMVRTYALADDPTTPPTFLANFGDEGQGDGQFEFPNGLATDNRARIYVTDRENARLQVWGY